MTPTPNRAEEIAEKICNSLNAKYKSNYFSEKDLAMIAKALKSYGDERAAQMRERCANVCKERNESNEPMPTERRAFDMHVAAKAEAFLIEGDIRALPLSEDEGEKEK